MGMFFTREDSDAFGRALRDAFPRVLFWSWSKLEPRAKTIHRSLGEPFDEGCTIYLSDDKDEPALDAEDDPNGVPIGWLADPPRLCFYYFVAHDARWRSLFLTRDRKNGTLIDSGHIGVQYRQGDAVQHNFARQIMWILASVSSPRLVQVDPDSGEPLDPGKRVRGFRVGHHALAWCRADARRMMVTGPGPKAATFRPKP